MCYQPLTVDRAALPSLKSTQPPRQLFDAPNWKVRNRASVRFHLIRVFLALLAFSGLASQAKGIACDWRSNQLSRRFKVGTAKAKINRTNLGEPIHGA